MVLFADVYLSLFLVSGMVPDYWHENAKGPPIWNSLVNLGNLLFPFLFSIRCSHAGWKIYRVFYYHRRIYNLLLSSPGELPGRESGAVVNVTVSCLPFVG